MIAKTKHAIGITTKNGTEILIHMGLDTVDLNGLPFDVKVKEGQEVKKGQLLVDMNIEMIKKNGKDPTVIVVLTQSDKILNNKTYNVANRNTQLVMQPFNNQISNMKRREPDLSGSFFDGMVRRQG